MHEPFVFTAIIACRAKP